jgi:hypothetical protein
MDRKGAGHVFLILGSLALVGVWRLLSGYWQLDWPMAFWLIGGLVGFGLVFCDRLLMIVTDTGDEGRQYVKDKITKLQFGSLWKTMNNSRQTSVRLPMRNFMFLMLYGALGILAAFSSSNDFGRGLVWGMGLHLIFDLVWDFYVKKDISAWYWQKSHNLNEFEIKAMVFGAVLIFGVLTMVL